MLLTKENILKLIDQRTIMEMYFPYRVSLNKFYTNPYRHDKSPGCYFNWTKIGNLVFFDNAYPESGGDCFKVCMLENKVGFYDALKLINRDFNLGLSSSSNSALTPYRKDYLKKRKNKFNAKTNTKMNGKKESKKPGVQFKVHTRQWNKFDKEYWKQFGISLKLLNKYNVYPVKKYMQKKHYYNNFRFIYEYKQLDPCYCYLFNTPTGQKVKLYRPLIENKRYKWATNAYNEIQGWKQLEKTGDLVVITSSLKDALTLIAVGVPAIAPQSETQLLDTKYLKELESRFKRIVVTFDADNTGKKYGKAQIKKQEDIKNLEHIKLIPIKEAKDFAEIRTTLTNTNEFKKYLNNLYDIDLSLDK